jgi:hypothetical protein
MCRLETGELRLAGPSTVIRSFAPPRTGITRPDGSWMIRRTYRTR